jgi:hypothetical protein
MEAMLKEMFLLFRVCIAIFNSFKFQNPKFNVQRPNIEPSPKSRGFGLKSSNVLVINYHGLKPVVIQ